MKTTRFSNSKCVICLLFSPDMLTELRPYPFYFLAILIPLNFGSITGNRLSQWIKKFKGIRGIKETELSLKRKAAAFYACLDNNSFVLVHFFLFFWQFRHSEKPLVLIYMYFSLISYLHFYTINQSNQWIFEDGVPFLRNRKLISEPKGK